MGLVLRILQCATTATLSSFSDYHLIIPCSGLIQLVWFFYRQTASYQKNKQIRTPANSYEGLVLSILMMKSQGK